MHLSDCNLISNKSISIAQGVASTGSVPKSRWEEKKSKEQLCFLWGIRGYWFSILSKYFKSITLSCLQTHENHLHHARTNDIKNAFLPLNKQETVCTAHLTWILCFWLPLYNLLILLSCGSRSFPSLQESRDTYFSAQVFRVQPQFVGEEGWKAPYGNGSRHRGEWGLLAMQKQNQQAIFAALKREAKNRQHVTCGLEKPEV